MVRAFGVFVCWLLASGIPGDADRPYDYHAGGMTHRRPEAYNKIKR